MINGVSWPAKIMANSFKLKVCESKIFTFGDSDFNSCTFQGYELNRLRGYNWVIL